MNRHFRILTLGLLLLGAPALAQTTPPADPIAPPADTATPAPPTLDQTTPAPATPDQSAPAPTPPAPATPAPITTTTADQTVTLPTVSGLTPLRTVSTVLGQAAIYSGAPADVLAQTLTALQAQGYATSAGDASSGSVSLSLNGQTYLLKSTPYLGLTVLSLSRVPQASAAANAPAVPATDTTTPAPDTTTPAPADTTTPPPTDPATPGTPPVTPPVTPPTSP